MTKKGIHKLINNESEILFLKKESEHDFYDLFFLGVLRHFIKTNDYDYLIITKQSIITINRNKILLQVKYNTDKKLIFNSIKPKIECIDLNDNNINVELQFLRLSYKDIQHIKKK